MKQKITTYKFVFILPLCLLLNGCIYMAIGGVGALGGYMVSPDTVEGVTENSFSAVWEKAVEVVSIMGEVDEEYEESGLLFGRVSNAKVTITLIPATDRSIKMSVKARKVHLPKISVAQDVYVKIMRGLNP